MTLCLVLAAFLFVDDGFSDVVALAGESGGFADVLCFLVNLEDFLCGHCPIIGPGFVGGLVLEVAFPVVLAVYLFPGYL